MTATATTVQRHATSYDFVFTIVTATATRNKHVHFSARLYEAAANHNAGIGMHRRGRPPWLVGLVGVA